MCRARNESIAHRTHRRKPSRVTKIYPIPLLQNRNIPENVRKTSFFSIFFSKVMIGIGPNITFSVFYHIFPRMSTLPKKFFCFFSQIHPLFSWIFPVFPFFSIFRMRFAKKHPADAISDSRSALPASKQRLSRQSHPRLRFHPIYYLYVFPY